MNLYQVKGMPEAQVELLETTPCGKVTVRTLLNNEVISTTKEAFEIVFEPVKEEFKKNTVTPEHVAKIMKESEFDIKTIFGKVTVVTAKLPNGFTIVESSACVDPANYNEAIGVEMCKKRIENEIWQLEGYLLQENLYRKGIL